MKTKIIYISGGEIFDMADVRSALDTVRAALNLGSDTVLFGVPVDAEDALADKSTEINVSFKTHDVSPEIPEPVAADVAEKAVIEKPKRTRKKKEPVAEDVPETPVSTVKEAPILSVIGAVAPDVVADDNVYDEPESETEIEIINVTECVLDSKPGAVADLDIVIQDFDGDDEDDTPKSIEDIFEGLAPIAEDRPVDLAESNEAAPVAESPNDTAAEMDFDETLSRLANEFVETQNEGAQPESGRGRGGKIGKLKNILPFKKKENRESSVLGDLFGWAGVAANDDVTDFAMPDFFRANG